MTAIAITVAAFILCYPLSMIADALRQVAKALEDDQIPTRHSIWPDNH
jgi:hypothetical protein